MPPEELSTTEKPIVPEVKIQVDYRPGRWGKIFHIFDREGRESIFEQKEATSMARRILRIARKEGYRK